MTLQQTNKNNFTINEYKYSCKNKKIYRESNGDEHNYTNLTPLRKNNKVRLHDRQAWKIKTEIV